MSTERPTEFEKSAESSVGTGSAASSLFDSAYSGISGFVQEHKLASAVVGAAAVGAAVYVSHGKWLFNQAARLTETAALPEMGEGLVSNLSNANFKSLLTKGEIGLKPEYLLYSGNIDGRFALDATNFRNLHSSYSEFLDALKTANVAGKATRREAFDTANQIFEQKVMPDLQASGVKLDLASQNGFFALKPLYEVPMNNSLRTAYGALDMNTVGGLRTVIQNDVGGLAKQLKATLPDLDTKAFSDLPAEQALSAEQRTGVLYASSMDERMRHLLDQSVVSRLNAGESVKVPLELRLELPAQDAFLPARRRAMAYFEETGHLFQSLNEGPLTKMGLDIRNAFSEGNQFLRKTSMKLGFDGRNRLVMENDLVGVLNESGIKPPTRFLNRPVEYQRKAISEMFPSSAK